MEKKRIYIGLILILSSIVALAQSAFDKKLNSLYKGTVPLMRPQELEKKKSENVVILDTRSPEEYKVSHIEGAQFVDYDNFNTSSFNEVDKEAEIIVYCTVGYRSERVGEKLRADGFKNVHNLYGGIFQWANEGRPLLNRQGATTDSVHTYSKHWSQWLQKGIKVYP